MSSSVFARVTEQIIAELEQGVPPWVKPWSTHNDPLPRNAVSQRLYRGINTLVLSMRGYPSNQWLTYRQALSLGGSVRKGEKATPVVFFEMAEVEDEGDVIAHRPVVRTFPVFNLDQCDGLDVLKEPVSDVIVWDPEAKAEQLIERSGAVVVHQGFRACYIPSRDQIYLPAKHAFETAQGYYSTALHELAHWTGHPSRLHRDLGKRFGTESYAIEELVAELGSAFLCAHCRIDGRLQHASYIDSWLHVLRRDPRAIFTAAAQAQRVADYLLERADFAPEVTLAQAA